MKLTVSEKEALKRALGKGGWGIGQPATTAKLAEKGLFEKVDHPVLGQMWRLSDSGREVADGLAPTPKKGPKGRQKKSPTMSFTLRADADFFYALDAWIDRQHGKVSRGEAIRTLVRRGLSRAALQQEPKP